MHFAHNYHNLFIKTTEVGKVNIFLINFVRNIIKLIFHLPKLIASILEINLIFANKDKGGKLENIREKSLEIFYTKNNKLPSTLRCKTVKGIFFFLQKK